MNIIENNPYRVLGLSIRASEREITKRVSDLIIYTEMGKTKSYDCDLANIAPLDRNIHTIKEAARKLEQPKDKLLYSLFWLSYNSNNNLLKELTIDNLSEVIDKFSNTSVYDIHNKAILSLLDKNDPEKLKIGIGYFEEFFNHPNISQFVNEIIGDGISNNYNLEDIFTVEFINELKGKYEATEIFELFQDTKQKQNVLSKLTKPLINNIESEIDETRIKTKKSRINANEHCRKLIARTDSSLRNLKSMLQESDIRFTNISNKLAEQILNSAIAYFNEHFSDPQEDIGGNALELANYAKKIVKNQMILEHINNNIHLIKKWIRNQICFYCKKNVAQSGCEAKISMYKIKSKGLMSTKYSKIIVPINRCGSCKKHHDIVSHSYLISFLLLTITATTILWSEVGFMSLFISILISSIVANIFVFLFKLIYSIFCPTPFENEEDGHVRIRRLRSEGWKLGDKPGKYERA